MKKKLTEDLIKAHLTKRFKRLLIDFIAVTVAMLSLSLMVVPFVIIAESRSSIYVIAVFAVVVLAFAALAVRTLLWIRWTQRGEFTVVRDTVYRKDLVRLNHSRRRAPALFFSSYGRYLVNEIDIEAYNNSECGELFYVVVMNRQPKRVVMAYSPSVYEGDESVSDKTAC